MSNENEYLLNHLSELYDLSYSIRDQMENLYPNSNYFDRYRMEYLSYDLSQIEYEISELKMMMSDYLNNDKKIEKLF
jgi:hypothetical protein